jgi:hypothetical protein
MMGSPRSPRPGKGNSIHSDGSRPPWYFAILLVVCSLADTTLGDLAVDSDLLDKDTVELPIVSKIFLIHSGGF